MGLNDTPSAQRLHIGFFGLRNAGKSSLVNAVTGQELCLVSDVKGTTTDPVRKAMELLPLGPVVIVDTPGLDDEGALGEQRVKRARQMLERVDIAVLVTDARVPLTREEQELIQSFRRDKLPYLVARNKADLLPVRPAVEEDEIFVSALTGENVYELKERLGRFAAEADAPRPPVADLIAEGDTVVLVIPIDESAPKGRLILPQQMVARDVLDAHGAFIACQPQQLSDTLAALKRKPRLVITDSQAFGAVAQVTPEDVELTSFSILMARHKGTLRQMVLGAARLAVLRTGDRVLIAEGCTHHRQCNDIGAVKLPGWIDRYTGQRPTYCFSSGGEFPDRLEEYALIVHCGGCMLNEKAMHSRIDQAVRTGIPIVNYGIAIAQMHGVLRRSLQPFPEIAALLDGESNYT